MDSSEDRPFTLVQFLLRGRQQRSIEIVPWRWVSWDENRRKCIAKYKNPPYTPEDFKQIQLLTENLSEAPDDWPTFNVRLKGSACTYSDALVKLRTLETHSHAFTSDESSIEKEKRLENSLRQKKLQTDEAKLRKILDTAALDSQIDFSAVNSLSKKRKVASENGEGPKKILATYEPPAKSPLQDSSIKKRKVVSRNGEKLMKILATYEPPAKSPLQDSSNKKRKVVSTYKPPTESSSVSQTRKVVSDEARLKKTLATYEPPAKSSFHDGSHKKRKVVTENVTKMRKILDDAVLKDPAELSDEILPVPSTSRVRDECREFIARKQKPIQQATTTKDDVHQKLMERVNVLQSQKPTDEYATVLTLCQTILLMLDGVKSDIQAIKQNQKTAIGVGASTYDVAKHIGFSEKFQVALPFKSPEEFLNFDDRLGLHESLHESFVQYLAIHICVDQGLSKNITTILKLIFTRDVAMQFTVVKRIKEKYLMKGTIFALCFYDTIRKQRNQHKIETSEKEFYSILGIQLTNSKDWDGHRSQRKAVIRKKPIITNPLHERTEHDGIDEHSEVAKEVDAYDAEDAEYIGNDDRENEEHDENDEYFGNDDRENEEDDENDEYFGNDDRENEEDDENDEYIENDDREMEEADLYDIIEKPL